MRLRAVGSDEESARRVGVPVNRTALLGYLGASLLTLFGAVVLLAQLGVGDPGQGTGYTLTSITAVVLGGTSLLGGRGTFIGTLMGAGLSVQVLNATVFLGLDQKWQYIFQGLLIVAAAIIYSQVRRAGRARPVRGSPTRRHGSVDAAARCVANLPMTQGEPQRGESLARIVDARTAAARDPLRRGGRPARARTPTRALAELDLADRDGQDAALGAHVVRAGSEFGVTVDEVLFDQAPPPRRTRPRGVRSSPAAAGPGLAVQRADGRPAITLNSGVTWERLMFWADEDVEFIEATYEPGGASSPDDALVRHSGHEFGYVLSGTLRVVVGFDEFVLGAGDSITFPSSTPHRLSNDGSETARAIWVVRGRRGAQPATKPPDADAAARH